MAQRGVYRGIFSVIADDPDFQRLSPHARLVLYTTRICHDSGPSALFRYYRGKLMDQTGLTAKQLDAALVELQAGRWIEYDAAVLWVRNGLRYDPHISLADPKHRKAIERHLESLPRSPIVLKFCDYYEIVRPFQGPPEGLPKALRSSEKGVVSSEQSVVSSEPEPESLSRPAEIAGQAKGVLDWLNRKAGKAFRPSEVNLAFIRARLADGIQDWQLRAIVSRKIRDWQGTEQARYLRPATLFNKTKCEQYLGELPLASDNGHGDD